MFICLRVIAFFFAFLFSSLAYGQIQQALEDSEKLGILNFCRPLSDAFTKEEKRVGDTHFDTAVAICVMQGKIAVKECVNTDEKIDEIVKELKRKPRNVYSLEHALLLLQKLLLHVSIDANCEKVAPRAHDLGSYHHRK